MFATGSILTVSGANALVSSHTAAVEVVTPLSVLEIAGFNFGRIVKPTSGISTVLLPYANVPVVTGSAIVLDTIQKGHYLVEGSSNDAVSISVAASSGAPAGLSISFPDNQSLKYAYSVFNSGDSGLVAPAGGSDLYIGGQISIDSALVGLGAQTIPFDITITYD